MHIHMQTHLCVVYKHCREYICNVYKYVQRSELDIRYLA